MEVECLIDTLGYLVIWLFGELHCVFIKLLVIVSIYHWATLQIIIRLWFDLQKRCKSKHFENGGSFDLHNLYKSNHSAVDLLRKTIGPRDVRHVTYFVVIVRHGTLCVLWNLLCIDEHLTLWIVTLNNLVTSYFLLFGLSASCLSGKETQEVVHFAVSTVVCKLDLFLGFVLHLHSDVSW